MLGHMKPVYSVYSVKLLLQHQCVGFDLLKDPGSSETVEPEGSLSTPPDSGSPKRHFHEAAKEEQVS